MPDATTPRPARAADAADAPAFGPGRRLQAMLDVEVALAEALAAASVIPASSVGPIRGAARAEHFDHVALEAAARDAGNPVIPMVSALIALVARTDPVAAGHVHWGATSQDVLDTALVLQLRDSVGDTVDALTSAADAAADLAARYAGTPMAGRTWLQQATPITFGLKALGWMSGLDRARERLAAARNAASDLQFGGATGTLSSLGGAAAEVAAVLGARLGLRVPDTAWHTERSRVADLATALGVTCGVLGKIGRDLTLLGQTEIGEVTEPSTPGRGGSSTMPHKHNPVASVRAVAASVRAPGLVATVLAAMAQEHERAAGGWQAEWDTLPALAMLTLDSACTVAGVLPALRVDDARMRANLDAAGGVARAEGLASALAPCVGRTEASRLVSDACADAAVGGRTLEEVASAMPGIRAHLDAGAIAAALNPAALTAGCPALVERALTARRHDRKGSRHG
ncbi:MAG: lyase family protein [Vicinamibacterales bacterium]